MAVSERKWSLESFIVSNLWRLERRWWFKRNPYGSSPITPHSQLAQRFGVFMFRWRQSYWWPGAWSAFIRFDEYYDDRTRGWYVMVLCLPLFGFQWQYRHPAWSTLHVETSMWLSLLPRMPKEGSMIRTTYKKVWEQTRVTDYRSWEEAARHHASDS